MKKMVVAVGVVAALAFAFSLAHAQFGGIKVPTSVQDVADAPGEMDYEYCKTLKSKYENNMDYNSGNIAARLGGEKNVSHSKDMKNWQRGGSKWDKENKILEQEYNVGPAKSSRLRVYCNKEKCTSVSCYK